MLRLRTSGLALVRPALVLILLGGALGIGTALVPLDYRPVGQYAVGAAAALLAVWWSVLPFLRWRARTYTITSQRLIARDGILTRSGHNLPLLRVSDVSYHRSLLDRLFGCGTLVVQTAADGALVLDGVPEVERVHLALTDLVLAVRAERQAAEDTVPASTRPARRRWRLRLGRSRRRRPDPVLSGGPPR